MNKRIKEVLIYALSYLEDRYPYENAVDLCLHGACIYLAEAIHHYVPETKIAVHKEIDHVAIYDPESDEIYDARFIPLNKDEYRIMTFEDYYKNEKGIGNPDITNTNKMINGVAEFKKKDEEWLKKHNK